MKTAGEASIGLKDRKRKISIDQQDLNVHERSKVLHSASRRHREKINATLEELGSLLPLPDDSRSKLDKLTVLKLSVSFFQTQNYLESGKRRRRVDSAAINEMTKKFEECKISVSGLSLEVLDSFFIVLTEDGDVFFVSENVSKYLGYTQAFLMHQNFLNFVHQDDVVGFKKCLQKSTKANIMELDDEVNHDYQEETPSHQVCFSSIRCHAGRQSSHVSPFYHRSFKFDGNVKPLVRGKVKQHGFFALCTPVNPANPFTTTPKELLQLYSCKMGLDLKISKLDSRGQKCLYLSEKDTVNNTAYLFAHPEDVPALMMSHTQVNVVGKTEIVFRVMNGNNVWQWVRGRARLLRNKANQPESIVADNVLLTNEQGSYYQQFVIETLLEWKANQKSLLPTETKKQHSPENSGSDPSLLLSMSSEEISHRGEVVAEVDAATTPHSKKMEDLYVSSPTNQKSENTSSSCDHATASPQSCMFTELPVKESAVMIPDQDGRQLPLDGMAYSSLKPEQTNSGENQVNMVFADSSMDQEINLIKQFLMEVDPKTKDMKLVDGQTVGEKPVVVSHLMNYSDRASAIFTDCGLQQNVDSEVITTMSPSEVQPSLYWRDDPLPVSGVTFGASQRFSTTNTIFPFSVRLRDHETDEVGTQNIQELPTSVTGLTTLPNGLGLRSTNLPEEGRVDLSSQSGYLPYDSGFHLSERQGYCPSNLGQSAAGVCALDSQMRTCRAAFVKQNSSTLPQFNQDLSLCQLENIHPDHLVSKLVPDSLVSLENNENFCNASTLGTAAHSALVCPEDELPLHLRKPVNQRFHGHRPPTVAAGNFENPERHYQSGEYSILKMILCEQANR